MEKAFDLFNSGDYEGALKLFEQALSDSPKEEWSAIHSNVGAVLMAMDDLPSAVAAFDEALKLDGNNPDSLLNRGIALNAMEKFEDALNSFNKALVQAPNHHSVLCGKSQALAGLRRFDEAVDAADLACKADPTLALGFQDKAFGLLKARRFHESNQVYETALKLAGEDDDETKRLFSISLVQEALDLEMDGDRDSALELFHRANLLWPDAQSLFNEGLILLTKKRQDEGVACLKRAIELDQEYFDANNALGTFYAQQDKFPESKMYLLRACELEPRAIEPLFNLGFVRLKGFRDVDGARKDWLHVLDIVPGEPHATEALRLLDEALRLAKERGSDGKQELDDAIKAIEKFTSCASAPSSSATDEKNVTPKLIMGEDGSVLGMSPEQADRIITALDRSQNALDHTNPATMKQMEEDCKQLTKDAEDAAEEASKAAEALKQALASKDSSKIPELGDNAMESALKAANVASATAPVAFVATKTAPNVALDAAMAAVKSADAAIEAASQALQADTLNADPALQTTNAAIDALQNAKRALDKIAADTPELSAKAKQASADAANAIKRGNQVKRQCLDVKKSPSYQEARDALRKQNRGESSLDRLTRGNNGVNSVPFGQGLLKKTGRMEALLAGYQPPVLVTDNEGKLVGMTKSEGEAVLATLDALPMTKTQEDKIKLVEGLPQQLSAIAKDTAKATKDAVGGSGKPVHGERVALLSAKTVNLAALGVEQAKGLVDFDSGAALDLCDSAMEACVQATAAVEQIIKNDPLKADFALGIAQSALASAKAASELCNKIIGNSKDISQVTRAQRILADADKVIAQANRAAASATTMKGSAAYLDALSKLRKVGDRQLAFRQSEPKALPFGQSQLRRTGRRLDQLVGGGAGGSSGMENMLANSIAKERGDFNQKYAQSSASMGAPYRSAMDSKPKTIYKKAGPPPDGVEFPFTELKSPKCPEGVDPSNKEEYLTAAEFKTVFGKTREEFKAFPAWRRAREKQQKGIF